jgi:hypothetical protein
MAVPPTLSPTTDIPRRAGDFFCSRYGVPAVLFAHHHCPPGRGRRVARPLTFLFTTWTWSSCGLPNVCWTPRYSYTAIFYSSLRGLLRTAPLLHDTGAARRAAPPCYIQISRHASALTCRRRPPTRRRRTAPLQFFLNSTCPLPAKSLTHRRRPLSCRRPAAPAPIFYPIFCVPGAFLMYVQRP